MCGREYKRDGYANPDRSTPRDLVGALLGLSGSQEETDESTVPDNPDEENPDENPDQPNEPEPDPDPLKTDSQRPGKTAKLDGAILWSWYWEHNKDRWLARATRPNSCKL